MRRGTAFSDGSDRAAHFGPYRVLREVGHGGAARVYEAEHVRLGKRVAIKAIAPQRQLTAASLARFGARLLREGRAAVRLAHPNVIHVFDISEENGVPYLVMEYVEGGTLAELLESRAPLPVTELVELFMPLVAAIAHAHRLGIVHRDLKPENCLLSCQPDGSLIPKLADFGVCKATQETGLALTLDDGLLGTPRYMAPEQMRCAKAAGPAADQYSLAVMIYQAATGELPPATFDPKLGGRANPEPLTSSPKHALPGALEPLFARSLAAAENARFASVRELGAELLALGNSRTRARWSRWVADANDKDDSPVSSVRSIQSGTWDDDEHSAMDFVAARGSEAGSAARSLPRRSTLLLVSAPIALAIALLFALRAGLAPALETPRAVPTLVSSAQQVIAAVAPSAGSPVEQQAAPAPTAPSVKPAGGSTARSQARSVARTEALPAAKPASEQRGIVAGELQMGRNGAPILD